MRDRPFPRTIVIIAFGPLVGALVMCAILLAPSLPWRRSGFWSALLETLALILTYGWVAGLLPAIASAIIWRLAVPDHWSLRQRALAALIIGFLCGALLIWPFIMVFLDILPPNLMFALLGGVCGAVALLATALPGSRR